MKDLKVVRRPFNPDVALIDGNALAFRSLFAQEHLSVTIGKKKVFTGMAYGFLRKLAEIKSQYGPKHIVVVWDGGSKRKKEVFPAYKQKRKISSSAMSFDDIVASLNSCRILTKLLGITQYRILGEEGDDIIGSYVAQHPEQTILVVTNDHDMYQLLNRRNVKILKFKQREADEFWCEARFRRTHNDLPPEYYPHFLAIVGDSTDEIPGVKGIGAVKCYSLFSQFYPPTIQKLYEYIDELQMTPHIRKLLIDGKNDAFTFLSITTLSEDLELVPLEEPKLRKKKLIKYLQKLKFRSILENEDAMEVLCHLGSKLS